jgi:hypothetical protein
MDSIRKLATTASLFLLATSGYALAQGIGGAPEGGAVDSSRGAVNSVNSYPGAASRAPSAVDAAPSAVNAAPSAASQAPSAVDAAPSPFESSATGLPIFQRRLEQRSKALK